MAKSKQLLEVSMANIEPLFNNNNIEPLHISTGDYNAEVEYALQDAAGLPQTEDFKDLRETLAFNQREQDIEDMMKGSELALKMGTNSVYISELVRSYLPKDTSNISLEYEAASNTIDEALTDNEITFNNTQTEDEDILKSVDDLAVNYKFGELITDINQSVADEGILKNIGSYVWHGMTNDLSIFKDIKDHVKSVNWGILLHMKKLIKDLWNSGSLLKRHKALKDWLHSWTILKQKSTVFQVLQQDSRCLIS